MFSKWPRNEPAAIDHHHRHHQRTGAEPGEELVEVELVVVDVLVEARGVHLVAPVVPALVELWCVCMGWWYRV